ncbi:MAG TPA: hypothetical protein VFV38_43835 [Ktedonobacteraceae bacterium]|nr:hypothetical protein [Ktedonobacteraceae bacterium]
MDPTNTPEAGMAPPSIASAPARLYALHLRLRPLQSGTLLPFSGEQAHGAFLRWR